MSFVLLIVNSLFPKGLCDYLPLPLPLPPGEGTYETSPPFRWGNQVPPAKPEA